MAHIGRGIYDLDRHSTARHSRDLPDPVDLLAGLRCADGAQMSWAGAAGHQIYLEAPYQADDGQECTEADTCQKKDCRGCSRVCGEDDYDQGY